MKKTKLLIVMITLVIACINAIPNHPQVLKQMLDDGLRQYQDLADRGEITTSSRNERVPYQIGDTESFWKWNLSVMPPTNVLSPATCRAVGDHCYLFVADSEWNVHMDQTDVDSIMVYLEEKTLRDTIYGAVEMDTLHFGQIPDVHDNDPKLIVFYSALQNFNGSSFDGYFSVYNQMTDAQAQMYNQRSNECEMIYMTCHPLDPSAHIRISVLSHELQHLIHWGADSDEDTWVDEGVAEYAMHLFGMPDPIADFHHDADNSLTSWDQHFSDYVQTYLFMDYLAENFGGPSIMHDIVQEQQNSMAGIQQVLIDRGYTIPVNAVFANWTIANFTNDYQEIDLPEFDCTFIHNSLPGANTSTIEAWSCNYIKPVTDDDILFTITASENIDVAIIKKMVDGTYTTEQGIVNSQTGSILVSNSDSVDYIVFDVVNTNDNQLTYSYTLSEEIANEQRNFNVYSYNNNNYTTLTATKRAAGMHCNVYVDDAIWQNSVNQTDADLLRRVFEDSTSTDPQAGIYDINTALFGTPSDIDANGKVNILVHDIDNDDINGYFSPMDLMNSPNSNHMEVLYIDDNPHQSGVNSSYCFSTLAHEFQHLIHHNYDNDEDTWVNEGLSALAQDVNGWISTGWMMPYIMAPDNNLTLWEAGADYPQTFLFMRYLYEHYNQDGRIIEHLVSEQDNSIDGLRDALTASGYQNPGTVEEVYNSWLIANYINDQNFDDGKYSYETYPIGSGMYQISTTSEFNTYPVNGYSGTVKNWGVNYFEFTNLDNDLKVMFFNTPATDNHHIQFIRFQDDSPIEVLAFEPDGSGITEINVSAHIEGTDSLICSKIVMIVSETSDGTDETAFSFTAELVTLGVGEVSPEFIKNQIEAYPNPFNPEINISFSIEKDGQALVEIYNLKGQHVKTLFSDHTSKGTHNLVWNGKNEHDASVSSGVYFVRLKTQRQFVSHKITLIK